MPLLSVWKFLMHTRVYILRLNGECFNWYVWDYFTYSLWDKLSTRPEAPCACCGLGPNWSWYIFYEEDNSPACCACNFVLANKNLKSLDQLAYKVVNGE